MKRLEIFPLDSCERGEEEKRESGKEVFLTWPRDHLRRSSRGRARSTARVGGVQK